MGIYDAVPGQRYVLAFLRDQAARARALEPLFRLEYARVQSQAVGSGVAGYMRRSAMRGAAG